MKRLTLTLAAVLMLSLVANSFGQSMPTAIAPATGQPAEKVANYEGTVLDKDGKPVAGATVRAFEAVGDEPDIHLLPLGNLTTGQDGKYSFAHKAAAVLTAFVVAEKDGYAIGFVGFGSMSRSGDIRMGEPVTTGGTVVDEAGKGLVGTRVNIILMHAGSGRATAVMASLPDCEVMAVTTDADGKFEFKNTPIDATVGFIVCAPGRASIFAGQAGPESKTGEKYIKVTLPAEARIMGILKARDGGAPIAGATIQALPERSGPLGLPIAVTGKDGRFVIGTLPTGRVTLRLTGGDNQPAEWAIDPESVNTTAGKTRNVTLEAVKGGLIEATVLDEDTNKPIAGARVDIAAPQSQLAPRPHNAPNTRGITNDKGFAVVCVSPGEYRVGASTRFNSYVSNGNQSSASVEEGKTEKIEIKLKAVPMIKGVVKDADGKPVAGADVIGPMMIGMSMKTDGDGRFAFRNDRFGSGGRGGKTANKTTILVRHSERGLVGIAELENSDTELTITLERGLTAKGLVTDTNDKPIKGAKVRAGFNENNGIGMGTNEEITTDDKGWYQIPAMPRDIDFVVTATAEGYGTAKSTEVTVEDKTAIATIDKLVLVEAKQGLSGIVQDQDGKAVAGARVSINGPDQLGKHVVTDKDGKFTAKGLVEGQVSVGAWTPENSRYGSANAQAGDPDVVVTIQKSNSGPPSPAAVDDEDNSDDSVAIKPASSPAPTRRELAPAMAALATRPASQSASHSAAAPATKPASTE